MDWDDVRPKPKVDVVVGDKLETLSVDELQQRIVVLEGEVERVRAELAAKRAKVAAAEALFKS